MMFENDLRLSIKIEYRGKLSQLQIIKTDFDLENVKYPKYPLELTPLNIYEFREQEERRKRFIDMLVGNLAHEIADSLWKEYNK